MKIRQLLPEEFESSIRLSEYAFQYTLSEKAREKAQKRFKPERVWGIFNEGELSAKLTLLPLQVFVQGRVIPMGGIAGVATWPENRRQGLVAKLLTHALEKMNDSGQLLSFLHPFYVPFYRKFGWEIYCEYKKYTIPVAKFPLKTEIEGKVKRDVNDINVMSILYTEFASKYNGTLDRSQDWWENAIVNEEGHDAVFYSTLGKPEGYVLYKIENKELIIDEFIYLNEQARRGLWSFLCNHDSMISQALLKLVPADDCLPYLLPDPRIPQENFPYFMARIVNAKAFVEGYSFAEGVQGKATLCIKDDYAPWNAGLWEWNVSGEGQSSLVRSEGDSSQADLICDIGAFTVLLLGYKRPEEMYRFGALTGDPSAVSWLEKAVPRAQTALLDYF
ncbi:GNAT family N-acetyltransferase [Paenibacillus wynnii]|uniref:Acetyltransferase n=1 Tax=Paenibacillus wynnii TaxID=268407 RepID=A0A098MD69_9BACL|nr:GNAT family N-acetyltransferase [Paenibacillus wynnii]KGE20509.1 acetyltransferase [Paenibacillus wynnii]